jgi:putative flavoprotein involved in K+ transport
MSAEKFGSSDGNEESFNTIVIGGGQAGLAVGYYLTQKGDKFVILDENQQTGTSWRKRWDSLKLFTPSKLNGLPGMPFPKPKDYFPTKNEVAEYLEMYASHFNLPIRHNMKVTGVTHTDNGYLVSTDTVKLPAQHIVIATGPFQKPYTPDIAGQLDPGIQQLHSSAYRNPKSMSAQSILVVGAGNSGAEISLELAQAGKKVWLAGRDVGRIPSNGPLGKAFDGRLIWWVMGNILSVNTPIGRRVREGELHHGTPLGRATRKEIIEAGIDLTPRVSRIESGKPQIEGGRVLSVDGVIWATGFHPDYKWINLPILDEHGYPQHSRGVVQSAPGLYFVGLLFQTALNSSLLGGVGMDAAYIAGQIARNGQAAQTRENLVKQSSAF